MLAARLFAGVQLLELLLELCNLQSRMQLVLQLCWRTQEQQQPDPHMRVLCT